jgi:IS30 family transposase
MAPKPVRRKVRQLSQDEVDRLVEEYKNGKTVYELGAEFSIHRTTVSRILERHDVTMRRLVLNESQRDEVARLRAEGWSYNRLGERFGVDPATVRRSMHRG